jgi:hypothetical protein
MFGFTEPGANVGVGGSFTGGNAVSLSGLLSASSTFTGNAQGGSSTAFSRVQPAIVMNKIIFAGA